MVEFIDYDKKHETAKQTDLVNQFAMLRIQEQEIDAEIKRLMNLNFKLSAKADTLRRRYQELTGNWLDKDGNIVITDKQITRFSD